ncbi:MAG: hypothetical protein KJ900_06855 [Proteobacteria bacterium]|jgi:hypothetical protein|nr:hypothetical protein [Pseudomonadota bacterium]MCG2743303.1 hypothetical protein [Desulfobacteraceae bacterium]MBU4029338.1 hypothetical protein [Pseudomonadota bacterium]MBU4042603.1 hypothetical protein [Pseudomonadota bacterium]MBU4236589.1 hypothetical protein [Pseudomonadota bacterium]
MPQKRSRSACLKGDPTYGKGMVEAVGISLSEVEYEKERKETLNSR